MKLINLKSSTKREELVELIRNHELVNERVKFDDKKGKPIIFVKEKGNTIRVKCQMTEGSVKDNGFLEGTFFIGRVSERSGTTSLKGVIVTAPIYHTILTIIMAIFVYRCISLGGFNPVPVIMLLFSIFMFKNEFEKQGVIERYLHRAVRKADSQETSNH